ncbi:DNA replication/repair protein RecF [Acidocella sp.]|uniref:DNA replication/repair protein RecF n=1 Tax=Acidocella sp. TaxID=50710 RepID=UPI00262CCAF4|nr:DNA replication/repair protein RecF [Acidocella sp.]
MIVSLSLTDFRSYAALRFAPGERRLVFAGPNGAGKTNLLEALSLLVPGRGLRGAPGAALARRGGAGRWAVAARFADGLEIGTGGAAQGPDRREFRLNGVKPRTQSEVAEQLAAVWLTPQMDRLFTDSASGRRRFLDRLVVALEPFHARQIAAFENAAAQRNRLLGEARADARWLAGLEDAMARHAVAATAARLALIARLNATLAAGAAAPFPLVRLALDCLIGARLGAAPALDVEDWLRGALAASRATDAQARRAGYGPHRTDLLMADAEGQPAALASTGQQKAMLLGTILGHAALIAAARGQPPLLLLDEPLVHLDIARRRALFAALAGADVPAWMTGTDLEPFAGCAAARYMIREGEILAEA